MTTNVKIKMISGDTYEFVDAEYISDHIYVGMSTNPSRYFVVTRVSTGRVVCRTLQSLVDTIETIHVQPTQPLLRGTRVKDRFNAEWTRVAGLEDCSDAIEVWAKHHRGNVYTISWDGLTSAGPVEVLR